MQDQDITSRFQFYLLVLYIEKVELCGLKHPQIQRVSAVH